MNNLYDVLETCLQELENGVDLESVLARYPDLAGELRPILKTSIMARARSVAVSAPASDAVRRGRAKLLQRASEMREAKVAPRKRMIPFFQRLAISFTLTTLFLTSGTGLVSASSSALPGENLYPVKLTWENVRLFFTFNEEYRETLEHTFENERLHEIDELLIEGRRETIQFAGTYTEVNNVTYVSGIHIVILDSSILPTAPLLNGTVVSVTGHTNAEGFVDVESIKLLPAGTIVPAGKPVEVEEDHNDNGNKNEKDAVNDNSNINSNDDNSDNSNGNGNNSSDNNNNIIDSVNENSSGNGSDGVNDNSVDNSNKNGNGNDGSKENNSDSGGDGGGNKDNSGSGGGSEDSDDSDGGGGGGDSGGDD